MSEYKCIGCGEIKNSKEECSCPICGYSMFEMPYERSELLREEIKKYILRVINEPIDVKKIDFDRYYKDKTRFPSFYKIHDYVSSSKKTEEFLERTKSTVMHMREYLHETFRKKYNGDNKGLCGYSERTAKQLSVISEESGVFEMSELPKPVFPSLKLNYKEYADDSMIDNADELLDRIDRIGDKIFRFVKRSNLYGSIFDIRVTPYKLKKKKEYTKEDWQDALNGCIDACNRVIAKKYVVDLFDDGKEELTAMLKVMWDSLFVLSAAPIKHFEYRYDIDGKKDIRTKEASALISKVFAERFKQISDIVSGETFLADKIEEKLFELYNIMLDTDIYHYMRGEKGVLHSKDSEKKLSQMIGLKPIKNSILKIKAYALANKDNPEINLHMCFLGNPGTGKTEVARIIAGILYENNILPTDNVVETDRSGLVAGYVGQTALKTQAVIEEAMGGVLFIDEAYSLVQGEYSGDYGHEAIAELIKAMEDYRGDFCVIFAGYRNPMQKMIASNQGFASRIQFTLDFPNYSRDELEQIAELMLKAKKYKASDMAMKQMLDITDIKRKSEDFANAREMRNIIDQVIMCQNVRCMGENNKQIELTDVNTYIKDANIVLPSKDKTPVKAIMTADEELNALVGLDSVKRMIKKIRAYAKRNKGSADLNLHMCFYGNPGTGKTETARILSRLLHDAGILPEAKLIETDANGLIGTHVGSTAPKTLELIDKAMGGVLFIDEAYSLCGDEKTSYGEEAIAVLIKEMEDKRGQFCVVLAGYKKEMESMLDINPGMKSRIQFKLDFADYTKEELRDIAFAFLSKKQYDIDEDAMEKLLDIAEYYRKSPDFANARTVRNILDQVIMNQNLRTEDDENPDNVIIISDVDDYISDEGIDLSSGHSKMNKIGF